MAAERLGLAGLSTSKKKKDWMVASLLLKCPLAIASHTFVIVAQKGRPCRRLKRFDGIIAYSGTGTD